MSSPPAGIPHAPGTQGHAPRCAAGLANKQGKHGRQGIAHDSTCRNMAAASGRMNTTAAAPAESSPFPSPPEAALLRLLTALDATTDAQEILQLTLETVVRLVPCCQAFAYEWEEHDSFARLRASASTDSQLLNDYFARFRSIDPFSTEAIRNQALQSGRGIVAREVMPPEQLRHHPFHSRFLARHGDLIYGLGHFARTGAHHLVSLRLFRGADKDPFSACEHDALGLFHTHVAHRLRERRRIHQIERKLAAHRAAADAWNRPIFLLDDKGTVVSHNAPAERILRDGRRLALDGDRRLVPGSEHDHASWMQRALKDIAPAARPGSRRRSRCVALPVDEHRIARHYGLLVSLEPTSSPAAALLILIDNQQSAARHDPDELRGLFKFTATEARIANALVGGMSTEEISRKFLIRPDTVRTHVKRLLAKTGTRSHAELQKLLLRLSPNLVALTKAGAG